MSNQVEVTIMGQSYLLACPAGGERALHRAVEQVDEEMCAIRDAGRIRARERIAVLAALNLAYQLADRPQRPAARDTDTTDDAAGVDALIRRIDDALSDDGQLL